MRGAIPPIVLAISVLALLTPDARGGPILPPTAPQRSASGEVSMGTGASRRVVGFLAIVNDVSTGTSRMVATFSQTPAQMADTLDTVFHFVQVATPSDPLDPFEPTYNGLRLSSVIDPPSGGYDPPYPHQGLDTLPWYDGEKWKPDFLSGGQKLTLTDTTTAPDFFTTFLVREDFSPFKRPQFTALSQFSWTGGALAQNHGVSDILSPQRSDMHVLRPALRASGFNHRAVSEPGSLVLFSCAGAALARVMRRR